MRLAAVARRGFALSFTSAALLSAVAVAGCGSDDTGSASTSGGSATVATGDAGAKKLRIAYFMGPKANTYLQSTLRGVEEAATRAGAELKVFDSGYDPAKQVGQVQDALAAGGYDAFVVSALDGTSLVPALEQAIQSGIAVATTVNPVGSDPASSEIQIEGQTISVMTPPRRHGELLGQLTIDACARRDPCEVAYLLGAPNVSFERVKEDAFKAAIGRAPNVRLVTTQVGEYLPDRSRQVTQDALQAHPGLAVVTTVGDQMALGAAQAAADAGKQLLVIGQGASTAAVDGVKAGTWFGSAMQLPRSEGVIATEAVIAAARGDRAASRVVDPVVEAGFAEGVLTRANAGSFTAEWDG